MRIGSLFTGYGGLDMAVQKVFDAEVVWTSDIEVGPRRIIAHRYPNAPNLGDVTKLNPDELPPVDIIVGGSPCQDLSVAGTRLGMGKGNRSGLWESMWYVIGALMPELVVWENVGGAYSAEAFCSVESGEGCVGKGGPKLRALGRVLGDLASVGYDAAWTSVRASDVGAPHQRERVFVVAYPNGKRLEEFGLAFSEEEEVSRDSCSVETLPITSGEWGKHYPAVREWSQVLGRTPPNPTANHKGKPQLNPEFVEWMMGLPEGWVTGVPGLSRGQQLRALGNGVVPEQGAHAIKQLLREVTQ